MERFSNRTWAVRLLVLLTGILILPSLTHAQTAAVTGTVEDTSGAIVADAAVKATNTATSAERSAQTSDTGFYRISNLAPGVYAITVEKTGFKTARFTDITLTVDQTLTLNAKLELGAVSQTVEVLGTTVPPVDTETAVISNVVDQQHITELPLILRDPYQLILLGPGVTQGDDFGGFSVNGQRTRNNNFLLDGGDNNDTEVPGIAGGITAQNPDSTQEFRVITNNFAPEFGRNNGAIIDVITRSGTNSYHGNAFWFGRYNALGARDFFNHEVDKITGKVAPQDPYVRNIYGASLGGPIVKDRTFFFMNYEGHRFVTALTNTATVPTAAFKSGTFNFTNTNCTPNPTANPPVVCSAAIDISTAGAANNGTGLSLDPVIQRILALYPAPQVVNRDGVTGLFRFPSSSREKDEDATIKIDHRIITNNNLSVRYVFNWFSDPNSDHNDFLPGNIGSASSHQRTQSATAGLTSTLKPTLTNELRFTVNRTNLFFGCNGIGLFDSFGFNDPFKRGADYGLPAISGFGCFDLGSSNGQSRKTGTYQTWDNMSWVFRQHTFKWGAEFRDVYANSFTDFGSRQAFSFNNFSNFGFSPVNGTPGVTGDVLGNNELGDLTNLLQGLLFQQSQTQYFPNASTRSASDNLSFLQRELGLYWQDIWKVRSNFSLTYGLRWEYYGVPFEKHKEISTLFANPSGFAPFTFTPVGKGSPRLYQNDYKDFQPRVGFAWDPFKNGRTSVRGGIGVFNDRVYGNLISDVRGNPPFQPTALCQPMVTVLFGIPGGLPSCPTAGTFASAQVSGQSALSAATPSPVVTDGSFIFPDIFDSKLKGARSVNWNLGVQREITHSLTVEANYVGTHSTRLLRVVDGNPPQPALVAALLKSGCGGGGCSPDVLQFGNLYFGSTQAVNNNAFFSAFVDKSIGRGFYDGLQLQVTERNFHGLQVSGAYTWSHALDDSSDPLVATVGNRGFPRNTFDLRREYGNSGFDTRQRAVFNFIYQPNIGKGRSHLNSGFIGRAFEGWELAGITAFQTGLPYDIFGFVDTLHTGVSDRATIVGSLHNPRGTDKTHTGPPVSAFNNDITNPPFGIPANIGRNAFDGPGTNNWNMSLAKTTAISERVGLQLRFEFYNLFNHVRFVKPDNGIGSSTFGQSLSQAGNSDGTTGARQVQVAAKLNF
jgi:hypothetical protein